MDIHDKIKYTKSFYNCIYNIIDILEIEELEKIQDNLIKITHIYDKII